MNILFSVVLGLLLLSADAFGSGISLDGADSDVSDTDSLRRGAKHFVDYCSGCHAVKHLRYSRVGDDLKLTEQELRTLGVMGPGVKVQDSLEGAMHAEDSRQWLGVEPPDLSLIARARGGNWLFTYLKGFYVDGSRPTGTNNLLLPNVGMPNVLWQLQGLQEPIYSPGGGGEEKVFEKMKMVHEGTLSPVQFDQFLNDLVAFLEYAGEPAQFQRSRLGPFVLIALFAFSVVLYKLKKEYWRDIS